MEDLVHRRDGLGENHTHKQKVYELSKWAGGMFPHAAAGTLLGAGRRRHGDDDPQHLGAAAALRVEAAGLPGGPGHIGRLITQHRRLLSPSHKLKFFGVSPRWCLPGCASAPPCGGTWPTNMAEGL